MKSHHEVQGDISKMQIATEIQCALSSFGSYGIFCKQAFQL